MEKLQPAYEKLAQYKSEEVVSIFCQTLLPSTFAVVEITLLLSLSSFHTSSFPRPN